MKVVLKLAVLILVYSHSTLYGQVQQVSDSELARYYTVNQKIDSVKSRFESITSEIIKSNPLMDKGRVYNKIRLIRGNNGDISMASPDELIVYDMIQIEIDSLKEEFKNQYVQIIRQEMDVRAFSIIREALKTDISLRMKYDELIQPSQGVDQGS